MLLRLARLTLLLICIQAVADERPVALSSGDVLRRFTSDDGLPQNSVNAIVQDPQGYLWLATFGGLARFDGSTFRVFRNTAASGPPSDRILSLALDPKGRLWIGTEDSGLSLLDTGHFIDVPVCGRTCEIRQLHLIDDTTLLVMSTTGTYTVALDTLAPHRIESISSHASHFIKIPDGRMFIGGDQGFWSFDGRFATRIALPENHAAQPLLTLFHHGGNIVLWFRSGLLAYSPLTGRWRPGPSVPTELQPTLTWRHKNNDLLIGTLDARVFRIDAADDIQEMASWDIGSARSVFNDSEGNQWVGSSQRGLFRIQPARIALLNDPASGMALPVRPIAGDGRGGQWFGMNCNGLRHRDADGRIRAVHVLQDQHTGCPWSIHVMDDGNLLVGTVEGSLKAISADGELIAETRIDMLAPVRAIHPATNGRYWVAANRSVHLARLNPDGMFITEPVPALDDLAVNLIVPAQAGGWWMSSDQGVIRVEGEHIIERWGIDQGLSSRLARAVLEEPDSGLWIGTYGGGLNYLVNGRIHRYHAGNGLFEDVVSCLLFDHRGRLWMSGNRGIAVLGIEQLARARQGIPPDAIGFSASDGLNPSETNGGAQPACHRDPKGHLWFPLIAGAARITPDEAIRNVAPPLHPVIESISVGGQPQPVGSRLRLPPDAQNLAIGFGAPSLSAPEKVRYRFRLGTESEWSDAGSQRSVFYPVLPWGSQVFEVEARNADGIWSNQSAALTIEHHRPLHLSPLTWVLAALLVPGLSLALWRLLARHLERRRGERETRLVKQRTRELEAANRDLEELTRLDPKTGIANHRHLMESMAQAFAQLSPASSKLALLLLDIDDFKHYNDHFGHLAGDDCLRRVAQTMQNKLRSDDLLARFGGEEFAVFMRRADDDTAAALAERLRGAVAALAIPHAPSATRPIVTISIGLACGDPTRNPRVEDLIEAADQAMYQAKRQGKDRIERAVPKSQP